MRRSGRNDRNLAGLGDELVALDAKGEGPFEHLEAFALVGVDVRGGHEALRFDDRLDEDGLAVGLAACGGDEHLAGAGLVSVSPGRGYVCVSRTSSDPAG